MLRISKLTDYAIVLMAEAAMHPFGCVRSASDLAVSSRIPAPTTEKILKALSRGGLLLSHRGTQGGYSLARPAERISAAEILRIMEGPIGLTECAFPGTCAIEKVCPTRQRWQQINRVVTSALQALSLEDMIGGRSP
ncbi:MAG: SUF system Fe-S cluster assembly regulator [Polyangiaceae bacterium]